MDDDFYPGDPVNYLIGKTEKAARKHAPQPPKPPVSPTKTGAQIHREIQGRIQELAPLVEEYVQLVKIDEALEKVINE